MTLEATTSASALRIHDTSGRVCAVVSPLAASLRALTVDLIDLIEPTDHSDTLVDMAGAVLAPWPNRVDGAVWRWEGVEHRLPMSEPELGNANHGLVADRVFDVVTLDSDRVELRTELRDEPGYPFAIDLAVTYTTAGEGLTTTVGATNVGPSPAPVAFGAHPYVRVPEVPDADLLLRIDATHGYRLDERHLPRGSFSLAGSALDLRDPTALTRTPGHITYVRTRGTHRLRHALTTADGHGVELWADAAFRWTQLYRAPMFPGEAGARTAVAIEPMTAPPNALRTGEGLHRLEPGETWEVSWGLRPR
ncbi:aldose epimerase family protein [Microbacterium aurum]